MLDCVTCLVQYTYKLLIDALAPHSNCLLYVTRGLEEATVDPIQGSWEGRIRGKTVPQVLALQAINRRTALHSPTPLAVTMHAHIPPLKLLLSLFSLFCSALSQGLIDAQVNIVKQLLQEGATHRSVSYHIPFLFSWWVAAWTPVFRMPSLSESLGFR
jgi:hypothetical protein